MSPNRVSGEARAWGWVAHLRAGGTTAWADWSEAAPADQQAGVYLPGAQQLELVRRLNGQRTVPAVLVERVLAASAPRRGRPDLALVGVLPDSRFGPPPVDPADLSPVELVGVATSLIAEDLVAAGEPAVTTRRTRRLRRRYRMVGDPELARPLRESLARGGRPPGGRNPTVVVLGCGLERMLVHAWTNRCLTTGAPAWPEWVAAQVRRGALPPRIDLARLASEWSGRVGPGRVHVVLDPGAVPGLLRARGARPRSLDLAADAVDLARRTAPVVGTLVTPEVRDLLMWHRLRPMLAAASGPAARVPAQHRYWLEDRADNLRDRLAEGDYAVHGRLDTIERPPTGPEQSGAGDGGAPDPEGVLTLAVRLLLDGPTGPHANSREGM